MGRLATWPRLSLLALLSLFHISNQRSGSVTEFSHFRFRRQTCGSNEFKCASGECIAKSLLCDGEKNCADRSDETSETCINTIVPVLASYLQPPLISYAKRCPLYKFQCQYGACVDDKARCNGKQECADGSDEEGCTAPTLNPQTSGCVLPEGIPNGEYQMDCVNPLCTGPTVPRLTSLTFNCNKGFAISGAPFLWCDKQWSSPFPTCKPVMCPPLVNPTRQIECTIEGKNVNCKEPMSPGTKANVKCLPAYTTEESDKLNHDTVCTEEGKWSENVESCATSLCSPLTLPSRDIECDLHGKKVDCNKPLNVGTRATGRCNLQYTHIPEFFSFDRVCEEGGKWNGEIVPCRPKCGEPNADGVPLLSHGFQVKRGQYPWHAGIYKGEADGSWTQICGGSIISPRAIVTAAHCFWNESTNLRVDNFLYKIVVGKYYRDWNRSSRQVQVLEIDKVELQDRFLGGSGLYVSDIAVIILKDEIKMTAAVRPVCVDYEKQYINWFEPGTLGLVVGWGATEENKMSETLRAATLPFVSFAECKEKVPSSFRPYLTIDKFCAGYSNGTSVCRGDSGGGYATDFEGKYYLTGIVSVGVPSSTDCNLSQFVTFTRVSDYYSFIRKLAQ